MAPLPRKRDPPMGAHLQLVHGSRQYLLLSGEWIIGRSPRAGVSIGDALASREHALVRVGKQSIVVEDLKSRNGTWVNGRRLESAAALRPGDQLRVGETVFTLEWARTEGEEEEDTGPSLPPVPPARRGAAEIGEVTCAGGGDRSPGMTLHRSASRPPPAPIVRRTALLILGDAEWAEQIRRAAALHQNLKTELVDPAGAAAAIPRVGRGLLLLDLDAAGDRSKEILAAWSAPVSRGPVLLCSARPEHEGVVLARELRADGYIRRGKPSILAVAQLRYHLQRTPEGLLEGSETADC